jgi:4-hydroxymandelate oxidase
VRLQRAPRPEDLVNVLEFEDVARLKLPAAVYSTIAGSDRAAFDLITFRPRVLVPMLDLDLTVELFGAQHFTPILVGPVADQRRFHPDGELATVRGASAAQAAAIVSSRSSVPIGALAAEAKTPLWYSVYAEDAPTAASQVRQAVDAGCQVICITSRPPVDWKAIDAIRKGVILPIVIKGVMNDHEATAAIERGVAGIVVSNHGDTSPRARAPIDVLASISDIVRDRAVLLVDGSFRRGSDILKALVLGAQGVLLARPVMWGLAGYGVEGVQTVIEMLQSDLARHMGALGAENVKSLDRRMIRIHRR